MDPSFPVTLSPTTVGTFAFAIPFIALVVVQGLKGLFYRVAPVRWQAWLPDRIAWPAVAGAFCVGVSFVLKLDVGARLFGSDWPDFPAWLSTAASGVALAVLSAKVLYPLLLAPAQKANAQAAVAKHIASQAPVPEPPDDTQNGPAQDPQTDRGAATRSASVPEVPEPPSEPVKVRLLTGWPVHDPTRPRYIMLTKGQDNRVFEIDHSDCGD